MIINSSLCIYKYICSLIQKIRSDKDDADLMHKDKDIHKTARITRDKQTKEACLEIDIPGNWSLFAGESISAIDRTKALLKGNKKGKYALNIPTELRYYFEIVTEKDNFILAEKLLPMTGGYNFRDLGGILTSDGRRVSWGKLFRADELTHLTESDTAYLDSIPIISVIDFRAENETKRAPDRLPPSVRFTYPIAITPGNLSNEGIQANLLHSDISKQMKQMNRLLVSDPACLRAYKTFFAIAMHNLSVPIVFHCSAGKDRTGMAAALMLFALGVEENVVMEDYLSSKIYLADKYDAFIAKYPKAEPIFTVKPMYLKAAINQIIRDHGSILNFLTQTLNINIDKLRDLYLDSVDN